MPRKFGRVRGLAAAGRVGEAWPAETRPRRGLRLQEVEEEAALKELAGRVAVVTGAASGMGRAFAGRFARAGMKVVLADIEEPALEKAVQELRAEGHDVIGVRVDVAKPESVAELARRTLDAYGKVHVVCNNAGVEGYLDGPIWEATPKDWQWTFGVNFWGVVHGTQTFLPSLLEQGEGHIVNTASASGYILPRSMYVISKHAVIAYSELVYSQLRQSGAPVGISLLCPGSVSTRISLHERPAELRNPPDRERDQAAADLRRVMAERNRRGRAPARVAEKALQGVKDDHFYIFWDGKGAEPIKRRFENVLRRRNPVPEPP